MPGPPQVVKISAGRGSAEIAPCAGGRLMRWSVGGRPVLHWPAAPDWSNPAKIRGGNPLLFPFIARTFLDGESGRWRGPDGVVRSAPRHGLVRGAEFSVAAREDNMILMRIASSAAMKDAFPFPFVFSVEYTLEPEGLAVAFTVENTGSEPMPFSVGNHFYFEVPAEDRAGWWLDCPCRRWARQGEDGRITEAPPPRGQGSLADADLVDLFHIGPPREGVRLVHRGDGRVVGFDFPPDAQGSNPWFAVTTWTESPESGFYCVEPWTSLPDAVHNQQGLRWLKPASRETLRLRMTAEGW